MSSTQQPHLCLFLSTQRVFSRKVYLTHILAAVRPQCRQWCYACKVKIINRWNAKIYSLSCNVCAAGDVKQSVQTAEEIKIEVYLSCQTNETNDCKIQLSGLLWRHRTRKLLWLAAVDWLYLQTICIFYFHILVWSFVLRSSSTAASWITTDKFQPTLSAFPINPP